ncbi:MAG: chloride channel protein [Coriobacteriia bacterium]|nr:chloride channel protein [Coriobacteriia bacterium]
MEDISTDTAAEAVRMDSREIARVGTRLLLLALLVGVASGAATWAFLAIDHLGVVFLWETLPERFISLPKWAIPVAVVVTMTAIASLVALTCKGRPFDTGAAEHEYDLTGRMSYRRILPGAVFSLASLFSGAPIGPEAPLVDINGGLGSLIGDRFGLKAEQVKMMTYGGVAGALAAFLGGAPVGALLAMEFISPKAISMSRLQLVGGLAAGAAAWTTYVALGGERLGKLFPFPAYTTMSFTDLGLALVLGAVGALIGLAYGGVFVKVRGTLQPLREKPLLAGVAGGSLVALAAVASPYLLFSGQSQVPGIIEKATALGVVTLVLLAVGKIALSLWSLSTAYFGGPLFPLMFAGLCLGLALNLALPVIPQGVAVLALIVGMLVAATVSPLSMTVFLGLISNNELVSVIAVAAVAAYVVRQAIAPTLPGVYRRADDAPDAAEA